MITFMDAFKGYFAARNRAWVTGETSEMQVHARKKQGGTWRSLVEQEIACKRRAMGERRSRILRAHTKAALRTMDQNDDGNRIHTMVDETVHWVYRDGPDFGVESRVIRHTQTWKRRDGLWMLTATHISSEVDKVADTLRIAVQPGTRGMPSMPIRSGERTHMYDRVQAIRYADLWWNGTNAVYPELADDCTNFISQCLLAGRMTMTGGQSKKIGWWYKFGDADEGEPWSYSWAVSHALYGYITHACGGQHVSSARELKMGDIIFYDWDGSGRFHHTGIVTEFDGRGDPLVNAHSDASYHRHYRYQDSRAWTLNTRYAFIHLPDQF